MSATRAGHKEGTDSTPRLWVVGSINVDLFSQVEHHPVPGETILGAGGGRSAGGKGANQALAAALQGAYVSFVGAVGADADAETALASLRAGGVDVKGVTVAPEGVPTGLAIITVSRDAENTIVVIPGANATVTAEVAEAAVARMRTGDVLLVQGELPRPTTEAAVRAARKAGHRVVFNVAPWGPLDPDVILASDPLVLNEHEAQQAVDRLGPVKDASPLGMATALRRAGVASVVITMGGRGAIVSTADDETQVPSPRVRAVDSTGAGDAFTGALAARLLQGSSHVDAVRHAVRVGAYAVQRAGAQPSYPGPGQQLPS